MQRNNYFNTINGRPGFDDKAILIRCGFCVNTSLEVINKLTVKKIEKFSFKKDSQKVSLPL